MKSPRPILAAFLLALVTLLLAACEGPDQRAMLNEARHSIPPMAANETYFDGQIAVHLTLGANAKEAGVPGGRETGKVNKITGMNELKMSDSNFGGGMDSFGSMGGSPAGAAVGPPVGSESEHASHSSKGGTYQGNEGMGHVYETDESEPDYVRRRRDAEMPPALMRLRLENTSQATVVVEIRDLNSDLGNFAVRPDTVTLNPGQTVETDPMQSKLGVDSYNLPVKITLRAGGQTETKTLTLRLVNPDPNTAPPPPSR